MSSPPIRTRPSVGESSAPIMFNNVVLPLPDGPRTTANSPRSTLRSTASSAVTVTSPISYRRATPSSSISAIGGPYPHRRRPCRAEGRRA